MITIIHPSRSRPAMAKETIINWLSKADNVDNIEYILSVDKSDNMLLDYSCVASKNIGYAIDILIHDNKSAIEAINTGGSECKGDLIIVVSDDFDCPEHWDTLLLEALKGKSDFIVKTQDGIQKTLITLPIMDRVYYERFGYVYHPSYNHMWSDTEMTAVGEMTGKVITLPLVFPHLHYTTGAMKMDAVNIKNNSSWKQGEDLFNERLKSNFGIPAEQIVKPYSSIVWK